MWNHHDASPFEIYVVEQLTIIRENGERTMADVAAALAAVAQLQTDVNTLLAQGPAPVDTQPIIDAVDAIDKQVVAATTGGGAPPSPVAGTAARR